MTTAHPPAPPAELTALEADILAFIEDPEPDPADFDALALRLFAHQFEANPAYRRYCGSRRATPARVRHWTDIPAVPLTAFKRLALATMPPEGATVFMTSGSTDPSTRGRNHHPHLRLYDASLLRAFRDRFLPEGAGRMRILVLNAPREDAPHSSIAHFFSTLLEQRGTPDSAHRLTDGVLDVPAVIRDLEQAAASGEPIAVLGTSFSFVHLLDALSAEHRSFVLPAGSRILDTGGFKGQSREVTAHELRAAFTARLGVPADHCANYYGMTEISTQYYDRTPLSGVDTLPESGGERAKVVPHWARLAVVDPLTRELLPHGEPGLLLHLDLANIGSCLAVLSDDIGWATGPDPTAALEWAGPGTADIVLRGRAEGSEARGCSLALDEVLSANADPAVSATTSPLSPTASGGNPSS